jgi:hypothetical protein
MNKNILSELMDLCGGPGRLVTLTEQLNPQDKLSRSLLYAMRRRGKLSRRSFPIILRTCAHFGLPYTIEDLNAMRWEPEIF